MNNPLHSLIYSVIANFKKIDFASDSSGIRTDLTIIGDSASEEVIKLIERELETRRIILERELDETKAIQKNLLTILYPPKIEECPDKDHIITQEEAYNQGFDSGPRAENPYLYVSKLLYIQWNEGRHYAKKLKEDKKDPFAGSNGPVGGPAWDAGKASYSYGFKKNMNPYNWKDQRHQFENWDRGWKYAQREASK